MSPKGTIGCNNQAFGSSSGSISAPMTPPVLDPAPLAEQAVAASKPFLRPDVALAPLPGFAPAVPDLGTEGVTVLPDTGAPLPGLARAT